jgi:hypothetical protein
MGALLAWIPFTLFMIPMVVTLLRSVFISSTKATGIGAVADGISEGLVTFGVAAILVTQVAAVILLARAFDPKDKLRTLFSVVSICCSLFLITLLGLVIWMIIWHPRPG